MRHGNPPLILRCGVLVVGLVLAVGATAAQPMSMDAKTLRKLQETIEQQRLLLQQQSQALKSQGEKLSALQKQVDSLSSQAWETQTQAVQTKSTTDPAVEPTSKAAVPAPAPREVRPGQDRINLVLSGQVNRAVNMANDGKGTEAYFVDNAESKSRIRLIGTARMTDDLTLGARLELAIAPNESSTVTQDREGGDENYLQDRWAEVSVDSKTYGKLSLGKGDTASNTTSQVDLSHTELIARSSVGDIAAGLQFRAGDGGGLTGIRVADVFNDQDGLSRQARARYDTPSFHGFRLAGSLISNQREDAAIFWSGQDLGFKAMAAVAVSDPNQDKFNNRYNGSFSVLHEPTGLNFTVSAGMLEQDQRHDPANLYVKLGWIANFFAFGTTAFGVDYTRSYHLPAENDMGHSVGAAVVQSIDKFGTELYFQYRLYALDRALGPSVENINVGTMGARIKF